MLGTPFSLRRAAPQALPVVIASAHSGAAYPPSFLAATAVDLPCLRRSEDWAVDRLANAASGLGIPLLSARFPRVFLDANREPYELDPLMFAAPLPDYVNTASPKVASGLGTLPRFSADRAEIYRDRLTFADALERIERCYLPYHAALERLIAATLRRFGWCILLDCHSMPSAVERELESGTEKLDFVLGDRHGTSCAGVVSDRAERVLARRGWKVRRNDPYAGAFVTEHYGCPDAGVHVLQLEVNRALYMDENRLVATDGFHAISQMLAELVVALGSLDLSLSRLDRTEMRGRIMKVAAPALA